MSKEKSPAYKYPNASCYWNATEAIYWSQFHPLSMEEWGQICHKIMIALVNGDFEYAEQFPFISRIKAGPLKRISIPLSIKKQVISVGYCAICKSTEQLTVDHIHPVSKGGSNDRSNLQCLCFSCNLKKSNKVIA